MAIGLVSKLPLHAGAGAVLFVQNERLVTVDLLMMAMALSQHAVMLVGASARSGESCQSQCLHMPLAVDPCTKEASAVRKS